MAAGPDHVIGSLAGWRTVAVDVGGTETRVRVDVGSDPDRRYEQTFAASHASSSGFDLRLVASALRAALEATSDDVGGAWIGMCGLRAALRTVDGRLPASPELARRAWQQFGDPAALVREVYSRPDRAGVLAGFAPAVAEAAAAGDQVAARIMRRAGHLLGRTASAAVRASGLRRVACTGGVFAAGDQVLAPLRRHLTGAADAELIAPGGSPLDGAAELARLAVIEPDRLPRHPPFISVIGDHP
jgi:N-acetylglucosamine kinase-like BadF-type ATPase